MRPRGDEAIVAAILTEIETVDAVLARMRVVPHAYADLRQEVVFITWREALRERVNWRHPPSLRGFLRVVTTRAVVEWWGQNPMHAELRPDEAVVHLDAERIVLAKDMLRFLRQATTPERWRALRAYAKGIFASEIARREGVPTATIFDRIRRARKDFDAALRRNDAAVYVRRR